jgi:thioredoxin reductase (NADPH)
MSAYLVDRVERHPLVEVRTRTQVTEVHADGGHLAAATIEDADGARERLAAQALFLCIGGMPRTRWAREDGPALDSKGYVYTGPDLLTDGRPPRDWPLKRQPLPLETSIPGLFAAGDIRHGSIKRVAGAVGEGAMAVALAHTRLDEIAAGAAPAGGS